MAFGETIRRLRKERRWNQAQLAEASGIPQGTLSRFERGIDNNPTQRTLEKLADAFEITVADFLDEINGALIEPAGPVYARGRPDSHIPANLFAVLVQYGPRFRDTDWARIIGYVERLAQERSELT